MNAGELLQHFERIADAPDAIARLRRFILDLAIRGKLVPQDSNDAPASDLIEAVVREHSRRANGSNQKSTPPVIGPTQAQLPFVAASGWQFVQLGAVLHMINGRAFKPTEWQTSGMPIVRIQNLNNASAPFNFCDPAMVDERHRIRDEEFLISWSGTPGTSFGAFIWRRGIAALNQHIFKCIQIGCAFDPEFLRLAINGQLDVLISQAQGGVGLQHVTKGTLESLPLPLPPIPEQHRIVAKVDELMALCDRLEAARAKRKMARDRLAAASLARLNAPEPETFREDARFALDVLSALTTRPDQIKQLRQTILNLAVRGKLVPQEPNDEPASELLKRIAIAKGQLRQPRVMVEGGTEPHPVPKSWKWVALDEVITGGPQNGISPKPSTRQDAPMAITLTATTSGVFISSHFKRVDVIIPDDSDFWLYEGDLLFQRGNTREYVGMAAIFTGPPRTFLFPDLMMRVRISDVVSLRFIHMAAISPPARAYLSAKASGAQATMPKINQTTLVSLPLPLPPLAEQQRIVAKVDRLMTLCDQLEASVENADNKRRRFLEALLHEALKPVAAPKEAA